MLINFTCQNCKVVFQDHSSHKRMYCSISCRYSDTDEIKRMRVRRTGIYHSVESRKKMSVSRTGSKRSVETQSKMSKVWAGRPRPWQVGEKNWAWKGHKEKTYAKAIS